MFIPASLPLEEAMEYYRSHGKIISNAPVKHEMRADMNGYTGLLTGICPVRNSTTMWLVDDTGQYWTNARWHNQGDIIECWDGHAMLTLDWPLGRDFYPDYTLLSGLCAERGPQWGKPGHILSLAEFGDTCIGMWDGMTREDWILVRALMIYAFDQEWGMGGFKRSAAAARFKHSRAMRRANGRRRLAAVAA
jgi:hypothetical protein